MKPKLHFGVTFPLTLLLLDSMIKDCCARRFRRRSSKQSSGVAVPLNRPQQCYSCMTMHFQQKWGFLRKIYYRPKNFTQQCLEPTVESGIGLVDCQHTVCIAIIEKDFLAGQHIGNNVVRGCFSTIFKGRTNTYIQTRLQDRGNGFCMRTPASQLVPTHFARHASNQTVEVCPCNGDRCNALPVVTAGAVRRYHWDLWSLNAGVLLAHLGASIQLSSSSLLHR